MIPIRYHGYPEPTLPASEVMRKLADGDLVYAQMSNTFEPLLIDVANKTRYAVPHEVDQYIGMISTWNRENRYKRMRNERI